MAHYVVDAGMSRLSVKVFAGGPLASFGHNPVLSFSNFEGEAEFAPDSPQKCSFTFKVQLNAFDVGGDIKANDRREIERITKEEILECAKFPEMAFSTSQVSINSTGDALYQVEASGDLALHGTTKHESGRAQITLMGDSMRVYGEVPIRQTAYGIKQFSMAGGTLKVKDEVTVTFELMTRRRD